jgi:hypothetical protein
VGTWGPGPFEDDTAMDFVDHLLDLPSTQVQQELEAAVRIACDAEDYLEYGDAVRAVVAASLLAGLAPDGEAMWRSAIPLQLTPNLAADAVEAIRRARSTGSHLHELTVESGTYAGVDKALRPVLTVLQRIALPVDPDQEPLF